MTTKGLTVTSIFLICLNLIPPAVAAEDLTIATYQISGLLEPKKDHLTYNKILNVLSKKVPNDIVFKFAHPTRAANTFNSFDSPCLFPGSKSLYSADAPILESVPIQIARAHFMATEFVSTERILDTSQPPLRVGFGRGNTFGRSLHKLSHHQLVPLNSGADVRALISRNRIDVYLGYFPDAMSIANGIPEQPLQYGEGSLYYSQNNSFLCHDSKETRVFIDSINRELKEMTHSGQLQKLLQGVQKTPN